MFRIIKEVPSKLQIQCKKGVYLSFDFGWYSMHPSVHLCMSLFFLLRIGAGGGGECLTDKIC